MISAPSASSRPDDLVDSRLVFAHSIAALVTVLLAIVFGIIISLQFFAPDIAGPWLSSAWGRLRYAHTQGIMLGWLGNAFLAFLYHAVPVLTGRKVTSVLLAVGCSVCGILSWCCPDGSWCFQVSANQ